MLSQQRATWAYGRLLNKCRRLVPDTFVLVLFATVCLASLLPASGTVAYWLNILASGAIAILFFLHGAKLPRDVLLLAVRHWRLHLIF